MTSFHPTNSPSLSRNAQRELVGQVGGVANLAIAFLYVLAIVGYPAVSALPTIFNVNSRIVSIPYRAAHLGFCLLMLAYALLSRRKLYFGWVWTPLIILWGLYTLRLFVEIPTIESFEWALGVVCIPMIALFINPTRRSLWWAQILLVAVGLIPCFLVGAFGIDDPIAQGRASFYALNTMNLARTSAAVAVVSLSLLLFPVFFRRGRFLRFAAIGALFLSCGVTIWTASRGPLFALIMTFIVMMWIAFRKQRTFIAIMTFLLLIGGGLFGLHEAMRGEGSIAEQISGLTVMRRIEQHDIATSWRFIAFTNAFRQFLEDPILGSSFYERNTGQMCHSMYLECLTATGIFGGLSLAAIVLASLRSCWIIYRKRPWALWVVFVFLVFFFGSIFSSSLFASSQVYAYCAAVIAIAHSPQSRLEAEDSRLSTSRKRQFLGAI